MNSFNKTTSLSCSVLVWIVIESFCQPLHITYSSPLDETVFKGDSAVWSSSCWPADGFIFILEPLKLICQSGPLKGLSQGFIKPVLCKDFSQLSKVHP